MKWIVTLLLGVGLVGCSSGGGGGSGTPGGNLKQNSGVVANFNGTWKGQGFAIYQGQKIENLDYQVLISEIPVKLAVRIEITSNGSQFFTLDIEGLNIKDNSILDPQAKATVGSIGSNGFNMQDAQTGQLEAVLVGAKILNIKGFYNDNGGKLEFNSQVGNPDFK